MSLRSWLAAVLAAALVAGLVGACERSIDLSRRRPDAGDSEADAGPGDAGIDASL